MADQEDKKSGPNINFGGNVSVGGNFVAGDQNIKGDVVHGDKVSGNKITIGNVKDSNVVIGDNATLNIGQAFDKVKEQLAESGTVPPEVQPQVDYALEQLQDYAATPPMSAEIPPSPMDDAVMMPVPATEDEPAGEAPKEEVDHLDKILGVLENVAPDAVEVVISALTNPGAAVGKGLKLALRAWRAARQATKGATGEA